MNLPYPCPAVCTPDVWASWEGKSAAAIHQRIKRKQIPPEFILHPTERVLLIDIPGYLNYLRDKRRHELARFELGETERAAGSAT